MSVEKNIVNPGITHEALKEALLKGDIDAALSGQGEITSNRTADYEFTCKIKNPSESFPNSPECMLEMKEIFDKYLAPSV